MNLMHLRKLIQLDLASEEKMSNWTRITLSSIVRIHSIQSKDHMKIFDPLLLKSAIRLQVTKFILTKRKQRREFRCTRRFPVNRVNRKVSSPIKFCESFAYFCLLRILCSLSSLTVLVSHTCELSL